METSPEPASMVDAVEGGAALAWRLLATLEGGSILLGGAALLAYTARAKPRPKRPVRTVLLTNTTNALGIELKQQFESRGCTVSTLTNGATSGETSGAAGVADKVDALVVVGAERRASDINDIARLVSEEVYDHLKLLDKLSLLVHRGGYMAWASAGTASGAFSGAADALDAALKASLEHAAKIAQCEAVWVGRSESAESAESAASAAARAVAALTACATTTQHSSFSIRNAAYKISGYIGRWLKIVT